MTEPKLDTELISAIERAAVKTKYVRDLENRLDIINTIEKNISFYCSVHKLDYNIYHSYYHDLISLNEEYHGKN